VPAYLSARLPERSSQHATTAAITALATVASNPIAWQPGGIDLWLSLVWPMAVALIAFLYPENPPSAGPSPRASDPAA